MKKIIFLLFLLIFISCGRGGIDPGKKIITVSIAPYKYFIDKIAGDEYSVNIMVPAGADPHSYEPFPEQISKLVKSIAYVSNGFLGFEMNWLDRFYEANPTMKKLSLGDKIEPLTSSGHHHDGHSENADPHYWVSPGCALIIATSVRDFLSELNPPGKEKYAANFKLLAVEIQKLDEKSKDYFSDSQKKSFMIYHPNLGYIARDYGLEEIPVEFDGKEPTPLRLRELIDRARKDHIKTIFVQREYDTKNAQAIATEIGASLVIIDPLSEDWQRSTTDIIEALHKSLTDSTN
jgi:zinc transport system substrate-binding protein